VDDEEKLLMATVHHSMVQSIFKTTETKVMTRYLMLWMGLTLGTMGTALGQDSAPEGEENSEDSEENSEDSEENSEQEEPTPESGTLPDGDQEEAQEMPGLSRAQHRWLEPSRTKLDQVPRGQTDYTAYTLEWGETKIGLASITIGALPRTQIGTVPMLDALGIMNGHIKVNILRVGPLDLGLGSNYYRLQVGDFVGSHTGASMVTSIQLLEPWSLHLGANYAALQSSGVPDTTRLPSVLTAGTDPDTFQASQDGNETAWNFHGQNMRINLATDYRFNRRDSLVFQAGAIVWSNIDKGFDAPPILGLEDAFARAEETTSPIAESLVTSLAWQWTWRKVDLRVGLGWSSVPGAWLLQSTDLSYRFGGKTRSSERRMNRTWKRNKDDTK
jgi:hypothetical protein